MRTALFTIAAAASALAFAAPASAQWYPQPPGYGYGYYNQGAVHRLDARVEMVRRHIFNSYQRGMLRPIQARRLDREALSIKNRLWRASRNGLSYHEQRALNRYIYRLEQNMRIQVARNSRYVPRYYGYRW